MLDLDALNVIGVSKFADRLKDAISLAGSPPVADLARVLVNGDGQLGASEQAVYAALKGTTKSFTAENCARAARFLGVDGYWLATGVGHAKRQDPQSLDPDQTYVVEKMRTLNRYQLDMLIVVVDAFTGPSGDRATVSISYAQRAAQPSAAHLPGVETPGD